MNRKVNLGIVLLLLSALMISSCNSYGYGKSSGKSCGCATKRQVG